MLFPPSFFLPSYSFFSSFLPPFFSFSLPPPFLPFLPSFLLSTLFPSHCPPKRKINRYKMFLDSCATTFFFLCYHFYRIPISGKKQLGERERKGESFCGFGSSAFLFCVLLFFRELQPAEIRACSWLRAQGIAPGGFRGPYWECWGLKPGLPQYWPKSSAFTSSVLKAATRWRQSPSFI